VTSSAAEFPSPVRVSVKGGQSRERSLGWDNSLPKTKFEEQGDIKESFIGTYRAHAIVKTRTSQFSYVLLSDIPSSYKARSTRENVATGFHTGK